MSLNVKWGKPYGLGYYLRPRGVDVRMYRKGQKVRFYTDAGRQVGPEQGNVAPAMAFIIARRWVKCCHPQIIGCDPCHRCAVFVSAHVPVVPHGEPSTVTITVAPVFKFSMAPHVGLA